MKKTGVPEEGMIRCGSRPVEEELSHPKKKGYCRIDSSFFFFFLKKVFLPEVKQLCR